MKTHLIWSNKDKVGQEPKKSPGAMVKDSEMPDNGYDFMDSLPWYIVIMRSPRTVLNRIRRMLS